MKHICNDRDLQCIGDEELHLVIMTTIMIDDQAEEDFITYRVNYCPICGYTYQPERLSESDSKE